MSTKDISKMTYPMRALGKVHVGAAEYPAGETFDALTIENVNFLKKTKSAEVLVKPVETAASSADGKGVDKAPDPQEKAAETTTTDGQKAGGKSDDSTRPSSGNVRRRRG